MRLYRVGQRWSNDRLALAAGKVYELTDDEAAQVERDCPGSVVPVGDDEVAQLKAALDAVGVDTVSFRPGPPDSTGRGRGPLEVMTPANMPGLIRGG